jgi:hypothetical protein
MKKSKSIKKNSGISPERLAELRRATLIASTGASTRLAGSKLSNKEIEHIFINAPEIGPSRF